VTAARPRTRPRRKRNRRIRIAGAAVAAVVLFLVGVALGRALEEDAPAGGTQTLVRTLRPLPLAPAARETVTVTRSEP
jgi:hypothetical protein